MPTSSSTTFARGVIAGLDKRGVSAASDLRLVVVSISCDERREEVRGPCALSSSAPAEVADCVRDLRRVGDERTGTETGAV